MLNAEWEKPTFHNSSLIIHNSPLASSPFDRNFAKTELQFLGSRQNVNECRRRGDGAIAILQVRSLSFRHIPVPETMVVWALSTGAIDETHVPRLYFQPAPTDYLAQQLLGDNLMLDGNPSQH